MFIMPQCCTDETINNHILDITGVTLGVRPCFIVGRRGVMGRGVNEPERAGTAFWLEFVQPERRSC